MKAIWPSRASGNSTAASDKPPANAGTEAAETATDATGNESTPESHAPKRPILQRNTQPAAPTSPAPPIPPLADARPADNDPDSPSNDNGNPGPSPAPRPPPPPPPPPRQGQAAQPHHQQPQPQQQQQQQQHQQPPPPQAADSSVSLAQLRRIVADLPRAAAAAAAEPLAYAYAYAYADTGPLAEETDEWFMYNFWQWVRLNAANRAFHAAWARAFPPPPPEAGDPAAAGWGDGDGEGMRRRGENNGERDGGDRTGVGAVAARPRRQRQFVLRLLEAVGCRDRVARGEAVGALVYLVLGRWAETVKAAGMLGPDVLEGTARSAATEVQLAAMKEGVRLLAECGGVEVVWEALRGLLELFWADEMPQNVQMAAEELIHLMTIMYMAIQEALDDPEGMAEVRERLLALNPNLVSFMLQVTVKLRWDETGILAQPQIFLLFWKSILLVFGGSKEISETKEATSEMQNAGDKETITASPIDYHVFRQEITSKYPAYIPPQPLLPLEADQTSLLPQLPNHPTRNSGANGVLPAPPGHGGGASILHQPVHIATPAPSPPPSPGINGKSGKKQNYQTNQNFPFMYPPLDATSNSAGGKGAAGLQDLLVGRKWEGSDVPASILEAGELFSKRVRMTRATRQLWEEREEFLKFERGWDGADDDMVDELDLSSLTLEDKEALGLIKSHDDRPRKPSAPEVDYGPRELDPRIKARLDAVEAFYKEALPHLQSLVIVLLKQIVAIVSCFVPPATANGQPGNGAGRAPPNGGQAQNAPAGMNGGATKGDASSPLDADVDELRSREIAAKAVTGILILLLKWLKLSHVLKFEYVTQLLLDSNYLPLALKIFAMHDVQQVVESKTDRLEHSFFYFCGSRAGVIPPHPSVPNPTATEFEDVSDDEAVPPPIKRRRSPPNGPAEPDSSSSSAAAQDPGSAPVTAPPARPEVDELGCPVNPLPKEPIMDFSRRNFFALINYLRIMQKICKHKAHRNLLLVQYKSSGILRKALRVPQHELRLYTLKLFKNQVPYCGRKWRQSNMRVITAVYLHCRPELRDEWLAGSDVDAEVEEALPLEQALRSLTHWFNLRRYPDQMAGGGARLASMREEQDFFVRELERADLSWLEAAAEAAAGEGVGGGGGGGDDDGSSMAGLAWGHDGGGGW